MKGVTFLFLLAIFSFAECELESMEWKAFKTPLKLGVTGTFDKIAFLAGPNCLEGSEVIINKHSVDTKNAGRDKTLDRFFFSKLEGDIRAKIVKANENTLQIAITMNNRTKTVPFTYTQKDGIIEAKGVIDIFDFAAQRALASIAKACYDKHQGKTWNDVELRFRINKQKRKQSQEVQIKSMM